MHGAFIPLSVWGYGGAGVQHDLTGFWSGSSEMNLLKMRNLEQRCCDWLGRRKMKIDSIKITRNT